jgi:hypothetical protein
MSSTSAARHVRSFPLGRRFMSGTCIISIGLLVLAVCPVAAEPKQTAFYAEVNECGPSPSFVCVELSVSENNNGDGAIFLRYFVHSVNFDVIYVNQKNLLGIPLSMFTVSKDGRTAELIVPAGTAVRDLDGGDSVIPGDIAIHWQAGKDRIESDISQKVFIANNVTRFRRTSTHHPAIATGVLLGFPVDSTNGWPDCCREPGFIDRTETSR